MGSCPDTDIDPRKSRSKALLLPLLVRSRDGGGTKSPLSLNFPNAY